MFYRKSDVEKMLQNLQRNGSAGPEAPGLALIEADLKNLEVLESTEGGDTATDEKIDGLERDLATAREESKDAAADKEARGIFADLLAKIRPVLDGVKNGNPLTVEDQKAAEELLEKIEANIGVGS